MSARSTVLSLDLGGGSGRGIVAVLRDGRIRTDEVHRFKNAPVERDGTLRWDLPYLFGEVKTAIRAAESQGYRLDSLSIDTWGVDYALVDPNGAISDLPYSYRDARTKGMTRSFPPYSNRDLYDLAGISLNEFNTTYQLYAEQTSRGFQNVKTLLFMPNALGYLLTGVAATEPTIASTSGFYTLNDGFSKRFLDRIGVSSDLMPEVRPTGTTLGSIKAEILRELRIDHPIRVVLGAGHDTACAVLSIPAAEPNPLFLSSGTWSLFGAKIDRPIVNDLSYHENYTNERASDGSVRFLKNIMGFWLLEECRRVWDKTEVLPIDRVVRLAEEAPADRFLINVADPEWNAPGNMPDRISKSVFRHTGAAPHTIGEIARTIFDSLAMEYRFAFDGLRKITNLDFSTLHVLGGGSRNAFLNRRVAASLGVTVLAGPAEATALGNAICQFQALGVIRDRAELDRIVRSSAEIVRVEPTDGCAFSPDAYARYLALKSSN